MDTELSWFDRNIIPLTKAYRDFIKAKERIPPERWNRDGERKFTNQQKKFLEIYKSKNGKKQFTAAVAHLADPVVPEEQKKTETIKNTEMANQIDISDKQYIVGKITRYNLFGQVSEVSDYRYAEDYLKALQEQVGRINYKHETLLRDPELLKKVGDLLLGPENAYSLEHYTEMVKNEIPIDPVLNTPLDIFKLNNKVLDQKEKGLGGIVGQLFFYEPRGGIVEVVKYTSSEAYINAIKKEFESNINGFKFDTVKRDPELVKRVDDLAYGVYGEDNPNSLEYYIDMIANENILKRYAEVPGSFAFAKNDFIDVISDENLLELKSLKQHHVGNEMRADNFSTIGLLRNDIDKISEVLEERSNTEKASIVSDSYPALDALADKLRERYQIAEDPAIPLNSPNAKVLLQQAIDIAKMQDEVQKAALEYINAVAFENLVIGDKYKTIIDSGKIVSGDEPEYLEFVEKTDSLKKILFNNEIHAGKLPKLESTVANYFTVLVGELKRNYSHEISQISSTNQFNYYEIRLTHQKDQEQLQQHKDQLKYLGFGEGEKLSKDLKNGIDSHQHNFEIHTVPSTTQLGNTVNFAIKYARLDQGEIILNSYDGNLTNGKGDQISQNFKVTKDNHFSANEAINLLEGRSVKISYTNPLTDLREQAFVKLNLSEEKNNSGNYDFQTFNQNYGVNTQQIVENSNLVFDRPELKDKVIKSLEKGDIVNVKISIENKVIEAKAVLNPQYKTLNLYDSEMNRINTNKPIHRIEQIQAHEKSNVRQQSISRGI
ncbi:hypothetical protein [uncultured Chryseobacterium sp.]|uniref:hypothetical protein n=1 Tax=uncultured Chryseobacterium sp. TaxID=259322 RepID=UPI0025F6AA1A|nr:hypothetical protein [uncultured Chryseobacterium sp.]